MKRQKKKRCKVIKRIVVSLLIIAMIMPSFAGLSAIVSAAEVDGIDGENSDTEGDEYTYKLSDDDIVTFTEEDENKMLMSEEAWDGVTTKEPVLIGYEYKIYSASELAWFASEVNSGNDFDGHSIYISGNINLNGKEWFVIGNTSSDNPTSIKGRIIIENAVISGLYISSDKVESKGLFGSVQIEDIYIDNLTMEDVNVAKSKGEIFWGNRYYDGALFGSLKIVENGKCEIKNSTITGKFAKTSKCGLIAGQVLDAGYKSIISITNCNLEIESNEYGNAWGCDMNSECKAGAIARFYTTSSSSQLIFNGVVCTVDLYCVDTYGGNSSISGGMIGELDGKANVFIYQCGVEGKIKSSAYSGWAGGIVGKIVSCNTYKQSDTYVTASIDSWWNAYGYPRNGGGFIGGVTDKKPEGFIRNSYFAGKSSTATAFIAKDLLKGDNLKIYNSYYNSDLLTTSPTPVYHADKQCYEITGTTYNCKKLSTQEMGNPSNYIGWDFVNVWIMQTGNSHPELRRINFDMPEDFAMENSENNDSEIIRVVREYASQGIYTQWEEIWNSECSDDAKFEKIIDLAFNYGITDPREGIEFVVTSKEKRWAYKELTTDELYTASNFLEWLDDGGRSILVADNLIFNGEINKWASLDTYLKGDYPGVSKYKDLLYEYMDSTSVSIEQWEMVKLITELSTKTTDLFDEAYVKENIREIEDIFGDTDSTIESRQEAINDLIMEMQQHDVQFDPSSIKYKLDETSGFGKFAKALGIASDCIDIFDMVYTDMVDIILLDSKLEAYYQFEDFLDDIISAGDVVPIELRAAATSVKQEIEAGGAWMEIKKIAYQFVKASKVTSAVKEGIMESLGLSTISSLLTTIDIESWFINQVVDIGKMAKQASKVEGYAYLAKLYKSRLEDSTDRFLSDMTEENAWKFYYDYNMLYSIRYKGEQEYLKMHDVEGLASFLFADGYEYKKEITQEILDNLESKCKFDLGSDIEIPASMTYLSKIIVSCPVDVIVSSADGDTIVKLKDGELTDITNKYGRFVVVYNAYTQDYSKVIYLKDEDVKISVVSKDDGLVNMSYSYLDNNNSTIVKYMSNKPLLNDTTILLKPETLRESGMITLTDGDKTEEVLLDNKAEEYTAIKNVKLSDEKVNLAVGKSKLLSVVVEPQNASIQNISWYSSEPDVVSVKDGKITSLKEGKATIYGFLHDSDKPLVCEVSSGSKDATVDTDENDNVVPGGGSSTATPSGSSTGKKDDTAEATTTKETVNGYEVTKTTSGSNVTASFKADDITVWITTTSAASNAVVTNSAKDAAYTIPATVIDTIKKLAGKDTSVVYKVNDKILIVNTKDAVAGTTLYLLDKSGTATQLVTDDKAIVDKDGNVVVYSSAIANGSKFKLVNESTYTTFTNKVLKAIKVGKIAGKKGDKKTFLIKKGSYAASIKGITFKSLNTKVATVNSKGVVTLKKVGKATIKVTVTLNNGKTKTFKRIARVSK